MGVIGDQSVSQLAALAQADAHAILADSRVLAMYYAAGSGAGVKVDVKLSGIEAELRSGTGFPAGTGNVRTWRLMVAMSTKGETLSGGVGADSLGVANLLVGDVFLVPGWAVGRPDTAEVRVRVGGNVRSVEGAWWWADVA